MRGPLYLAWRYLATHRLNTSILVGSIALVVFLPVGLNVVVREGADELMARAEATPLLVGAPGSALELALSSLYFEPPPPRPARYAEVARVIASGWASAAPLFVRFQARGHPIVGTTLEYLDFRGLQLREGRQLALLGECVLGARAAERLQLGPGDPLVSTPENVFDLAGVYPLKMRVVGVLAPAHTADDEAVFVDLKTAWVIQGLGHGHRELAGPGPDDAVLARQGDSITANASVVQYNEVDPDNLASFHFHGDLSDYPITAVLAVPHDAKARALLMGRYESPSVDAQIVRPVVVIRELLDTVLTVEAFVVAAIGTVALATGATAALVFLLSIRLRRRELDTLAKLGSPRTSVGLLLASEIAFVLALGGALAGALTAVTSRFGGELIRAFLRA